MSRNITERVKEKETKVSSLASEIKNFGSFLIFEYLGLNAEEISVLRKNFRSSESKLVVHKNNILSRALKELKLDVPEGMHGPNAILLTKNDIKPFQDIVKLGKDKDFLKLKLAYFDNEIIADKNLALLSTLSSKEDLLVKFVQTLMSPICKLAVTVKHVPGN